MTEPSVISPDHTLTLADSSEPQITYSALASELFYIRIHDLCPTYYFLYWFWLIALEIDCALHNCWIQIATVVPRLQHKGWENTWKEKDSAGRKQGYISSVCVRVRWQTSSLADHVCFFSQAHSIEGAQHTHVKNCRVMKVKITLAAAQSSFDLWHRAAGGGCWNS